MSRARPDQGIWFRDEDRPRRPRLSRERIIQAAIGLLDVEGVDGLSMRRLAARLHVGTMSLYEYVATKEDVLDQALDAVIAEIDLNVPDDGNWRNTLARQLTQSRQIMRRHRWVPGLMGTRPLLGPNALARSEHFYTVLIQAGLAGPQLLAAVGALTYYVSGYVAAENVWQSRIGDTTDDAELRQRVQERIAEQSDLYPTLSRHAQLDVADFDVTFNLGLKTILDGIQAQIAGQNSRNSSDSAPRRAS